MVETQETPNEAIVNHTKNDKQLWRTLCTPTVTIRVGPSEQQFQIHRDLLCCHSLFFRHMLRSGRFPESKDNTIRLPKDDALSFAVFAEYLYVGDECDTGAVFRDVRLKGMPGSDEKEPEIEDEENAAHDEYDSCFNFLAMCWPISCKHRNSSVLLWTRSEIMASSAIRPT